MTTYNTGNSIGSTSPKDLYDNAENLDVLLLDQEKLSHPDRRGVPRWTWHGMEERFAEFLASSGYVQANDGLNDYDADSPFTITTFSEYIIKDGTSYRLSPENATVPYETNGNWAEQSGDFVALDDAILRQDLNDPAQGGNIVQVSTETGDQSLVNALNSRDHRIVTPEMFNAAGDGVTSDRQAWIDALATGYVVEGLPGKIYNVEDGFDLTGAKFRMNGARFLLTVDSFGGSGIFPFTAGTGTYVDDLRVTVASGVRSDQVLLVSGDGARFSAIDILSEDQQANQVAAAYAAVRVSGTNARIDNIYVENYDNSMTWSGRYGRLEKFECVSYVRGIWFDQAEDFQFGRIIARVRSPNAINSPGENGVLTQDVINFNGNSIDVYDAGEHGVRFSGSNGSEDVRIGRISAVNTGGAGVKWRCDHNSYCRRFVIGEIYCEDCGDDPIPTEGRDGLRIDRTRNMTIGSYTVARRFKTFSTAVGISYMDCHDINIGVVNMANLGGHGVRLRSTTDDGSGTGVYRNSSGLTIGEGTVNGCEEHMVIIDLRENTTARRIHFNLKGVNIKEGILRAEVFTGGAIAEDSIMNLHGEQTGTPTFDPVSGNGLEGEVMLDVSVYQAPGTTGGRNGSMWWDLSSGTRYIKNPVGNWTALGAVA